MSMPARRYAEQETLVEEGAPEEETRADAYGWPQPRPRRRPARPAAPPSRRHFPPDEAWVVLAILGVAAAAAAAIWYLSLDRTPPPSTLTVPRVVGLRERVAVTRLTREGFSVRAIERPGNAKPGHVFSQRPAPLARLARGATITIRVANGQKP
jgi:hypothetical protein